MCDDLYLIKCKMETGKSSSFVLLGFGFNGYRQLSSSQDDTSGTKSAEEATVAAPKQLLVSSRSKFHVSIAWDSLHVCTEDVYEDTGSNTGGRWSEMVASAQSKLGEQVTKIAIDTVQGMVLLTRSHTYIARQTDKELRLTEIPDDQLCSSYAVLSDGKMYGLAANGLVYSISMETSQEGADKLLFGPAQHIPNQIAVCQMACGVDHVLALSKCGDLFSFGLNGRGQLGQGDILERTQPALVKALAGIKTVSIACGHWHCLALSEFGDVYTWGWNEHGQLGHSLDVPVVAVPTLIELPPEDEEDTNFVSVGCGERHSVAVSEDGGMYTWGWNRYGQLGRSTNTDIDKKPQLMDLEMAEAVEVHCGYWNTLIVVRRTMS